MKPSEFADLCHYVSLHNGWGDGLYEKAIKANRKAIKHIQAFFDSRDGSIYKVKFSCITDWVNERTFATATKEDIEAIYKWLDEPPVTEESMRQEAFPTAKFDNGRANS